MIYIDGKSTEARETYIQSQTINNHLEKVLTIVFLKTDHKVLLDLLNPAKEIINEQERTISVYQVRICYDIIDSGNFSYAKVRINSHTTYDNPTYYKTKTQELEQKYTDTELELIETQQQLTDLELQLLEVEQ